MWTIIRLIVAFSCVNQLTNYSAELPVVRAAPVGERDIDYETWFETLREIGYQGWVVYEMCEVPDDNGTVENLNHTVRISLKYMEQLKATNNTLTEAEKKGGWRLLFDGKTFNGWRGIGLDNAPEGWIIEDGTIKIQPKTNWPRQADGQPILGVDLMTDGTYENFELTWEWKIGSGGNSGVKYNVSEKFSMSYPPKRCALGFEYQMMDDSGTSGSTPKDNSTGALYDLVAPCKDKLLKPIGEFNTSRIIINGNHGEHWLNGKKVLEYEIDTPHFDSLLSKSKFSAISGFAQKRKGHLVLQDHAEAVWYRNIKVRRLKNKTIDFK